MTDSEFVARVFARISRGNPQAKVGVYRPAIQSIIGQSLQKLADKVAADSVSYELLQQQYDLTLVAGEASLLSLTPTLLHSKQARKHWRVTMTGVTNPLKALPNRCDLDNPPPISSYYYYNVFKGKLTVRKSDKTIPTETAVQLIGNYVPLIGDASLATTGELSDDLIEIGIEIMAGMQVAKEQQPAA
jgi:hypothetical protein